MQVEDKAALRARLRSSRADFALTAPALSVPRQFSLLLRPGITVASYLPFAQEADPTPLAEAAHAQGARLVLPHVTGKSAPMRMLVWRPGQPLCAGPMGLRQPHGNADDAAPDIVLTPLLAFDRFGNRLGQGAGYYDRFFADLPAVLRIGVAWSIQRVDQLPVDAWDIPLHAIVTEQGWIDAEPTP